MSAKSPGNRTSPASGAAGSARRVPFIAVGVGAVVIVAAVLAVVLTRGSDDGGKTPAGTAQTRPVVVTGSPLPAYDAATTPDPAVGTAIPALLGADFAGKPVRIANNGKAKALIFVAHWCPHCQREVPILAPNLRDEPLPENTEEIGRAHV